MSSWSNNVTNSMKLTQPPVHEPCESLVAQFGEPAEELLREMGSALAVLIGAVERIAPGEFLENDPMAVRQAQEAHLKYVRAANEYVAADPSPYRRRTEFADSPLQMMDRVWEEIGTFEGVEITTARWYLGTVQHGSDQRSQIVLGSFAVVNENPVMALLTFGDTEMHKNEYRVTLLTGTEALRWRQSRGLGGGFWEESHAAEFDKYPL